MEIKTVGVLGCGLMGAGIAQVCAAAGYKTIVREVEEALLNKGLGTRPEVPRPTASTRARSPPEAKEKTLATCPARPDFEDLSDCDLVIEAIIENIDEKAKTYARARRGRRRSHHLLLEHLVALHHRAGRENEAPRPVRRPALLQSGAADEARRSDPRPDDERRDLSARSSPSRSRSARSRSPLPTGPASSSTACSCRTCSTRSARTSTGSARSKTSTRA